MPNSTAAGATRRRLPLAVPPSPRAFAEPAPRTPITTRLTELKAKVFVHGLRIAPELWEELTDENHYRHKRAGLSQGRFFRLVDGAAHTAVNAPVLEPFVASSPLTLEREGDGYAIHESGERLAACVPFAWPRWYKRTTRAGAPMSSVVSAHCDTSLYTAIYQGGCDYWQDDQMCAFCAMKIDQKAKWRSVETIIEVAKVALEENAAAEISFGGGTRLAEDKSARHKAEAIEAFKKEVPMRVCVEMAAPDTDGWLDRLKDAGLDSILLNLELWGEDARRRIMPGKSAISRERYLAALAHAAKILGPSQASSQIIVGLEPLADTLLAIGAVADAGAIPMPVAFRPLPGTALEGHPPPTVADVLEAFQAAHDAVERAGLRDHAARSGCALCGGVLGGLVTAAAASYRATLKPGQVETWLDLGFFRPVAYAVVRLALPTPLSANGMTALSIAAGLAGAVLLRFDGAAPTAAGCALMILYGVLDCADGQLARARGTSSRLGRILDGASDYIVGVTSGVAIALRLGDTMGASGLCLAAGGLASILVQGTLFDHFKNRYLSRSRSSYREGDDLEETLAAIEEHRRAGASPVVIGLHHVYATFLRVQRLASGPAEAPASEAEARAYGERLAPVARAWAYLGPSTHLVLLGAFLAAGRLDLYVWLRLVAGNAAMVALLVEQRRREREVRDQASIAASGS